jgi:uncharacterized protein YeaO (DUF488 family)
MALRVVRLGSARLPGEGLRVGTVRRPPRGVRKEDYATLDYFEVWLPARSYRKQMSTPESRHLIGLLAAMSKHADLSVGCYCDDESRCHRSLLRELLVDAGATIA